MSIHLLSDSVRCKLILLAALVLSGVAFYKSGRSVWHPLIVKLNGKKTVPEVVAIYGADARSRLQPYFDEAGVPYPPKDIKLLAIKETKALELWVDDASGPAYIRTYTVEALSGVAGPKLREGDKQVPEGLYQISGLNPNSSFHLSMKLNYPNAFDLKYASIEGRNEPGSNIFIHGKASSIGCLAMGDPVIEELFVLVNDVGHENVSVVIAPTDPRLGPLQRVEHLPWTEELYAKIERQFSNYRLQGQIN